MVSGYLSNVILNCAYQKQKNTPAVTFFFNGGVETEFEGEERQLVASPKVAKLTTYNLK